MEQEFIRQHVDLSSYFNTSPCFQHNSDWLTKQKLDVLFSLQFPFLEGLDLDTLICIKKDYRDEFESFSRVMLGSLNSVKSAIDIDTFASEVRNIQRNMVDAGVNDVEKTFKKITAMSSLRKRGMAVGLLGLNAAALFGAPQLALVSGLAAAGVKMAADKIEELIQSSSTPFKRELWTKSMKRFWRLRKRRYSASDSTTAAGSPCNVMCCGPSSLRGPSLDYPQVNDS